MEHKTRVLIAQITERFGSRGQESTVRWKPTWLRLALRYQFDGFWPFGFIVVDDDYLHIE